MNRVVLPTEIFLRAVKKLAKKNSKVADDVEAALKLLSADAFHPQLKTHKLKGNFKDCGHAAQATTCGSSLSSWSTGKPR